MKQTRALRTVHTCVRSLGDFKLQIWRARIYWGFFSSSSYFFCCLAHVVCLRMDTLGFATRLFKPLKKPFVSLLEKTAVFSLTGSLIYRLLTSACVTADFSEHTGLLLFHNMSVWCSKGARMLDFTGKKWHITHISSLYLIHKNALNFNIFQPPLRHKRKIIETMLWLALTRGKP